MNDPKTNRQTLAQLVADYDWLEAHCRKQPELARHAGHLRLAAALARNIVGGSLEARPDAPLHIAVVGGAGSGKSTVANFLVGSNVAEANPQAGYTRHPIAFTFSPPTSWPSYLGFLGPLRKLTESRPSNLDQDVYQVRPVTAATPDDPLADDVVWDCPDMTTWASTGYVSRLIEVAALADLIVYVASDERYNDEVPTQFLQLLVKAGKAVIVVLTKMREADAPALTEHFRKEVLAKIHDDGTIPPIPVVAIPNLPQAERDDPAKTGAKWRVQLVNQLLVLCPTAKDARARTLGNAVRYLETSSDSLLEVARKDLIQLEGWKAAVSQGQRTFEERYVREYLVGEPFRRFDQSRRQLMEQLAPTGPAEYVGKGFAYLRLPFSLAWDFVAGMGRRTDMPNLPEGTVLANAWTGWMEALQAECLRRADSGGLWKESVHAFESGLKQQGLDRFAAFARQFEQTEGDELEQAGRKLTESLAANPSMLGLLRYGKLAVDIAAVAVVVWWTWVPSWYHVLLLPVAAAASHLFAELVIRWRVELVRVAARRRRESRLREQVAAPLARWLDEVPATGGSSVERLQQVLRRVPENLKALAAAVSLAKTV
ncbi:MAG: GTPase domain-containing protein [Planctomycetia bacterium]|nr:GTPase domain-containing protein [Planctomycetia bacterium]